MLYINNTFVAPAGAVYDLLEDHDKVFLTKSEAKVFSKLYGFRKLPVYNDVPCVDYFAQAANDYEASTKNFDSDLVVHNHTGAVCGVFGERVMLHTGRKMKTEFQYQYSVSSAKCATPMQLFNLFHRNDLLNDVVLITGDVADHDGLRVNPVAMSSDTICFTQLTKSPTNIAIRSVATLYDGQFSQGIWLDSNDETFLRYDRCYRVNVEKVVDRCLDKIGMEREQIDYIIPHNVNIHTWEKLAAHLNFSMDQVFTDNIAKYGHCFGGDIFVNLQSLIHKLKSTAQIEEESLVQSSDEPLRCLAISAGIGASFGAALLEIRPEVFS